ncbi:spermidine hydroxycinnamoyl transferase-like protein, partial [Tanacetum coccineum]
MVNVKQSFVIKPAKPTPSVAMCVSELDQEKPITHALTIYFYCPPSDSFSFTLACGRVALACNSSGAVFYEARSSAKTEDFNDFSLPNERRSLVPVVDYALDLHELSLLVVQLTELSCGGISLGIGVSIILVDGTCASHFISEWARIARGNPIENQPFLD